MLNIKKDIEILNKKVEEAEKFGPNTTYKEAVDIKWKNAPILMPIFFRLVLKLTLVSIIILLLASFLFLYK